MSFTSAVVKLTARCNLDCTYCYMFNQQDRTFTRVPALMDLPTALLLLQRVREHLLDSGGARFKLVLHGGEPTLWPLSSYRAFLKSVDRLRAEGLDIRISVQTNAYKLSDDLVDLLASYGVKLGISLDGPPSYNDSRRITHAGKGSYQKVMASVNHLLDRGLGTMISGFLCVADPSIAPELLLDWASDLPVRRLDLLWPMEFNYDQPPWLDSGHASYRRHPRYGGWFAAVFDEWWRRDDPELVIRLFYETILYLLGSRQHTDMIVNDTLSMFVVNTDGAIEYHDYLRSYDDGATRTRFHLSRDRLSDLAVDELFDYCLNLKSHLPPECRTCQVVSVCGGGFLPGRMKQGYALPSRRSVLCYDQFQFLTRVIEHVRPYLPAPTSALVSQDARAAQPPELALNLDGPRLPNLAPKVGKLTPSNFKAAVSVPGDLPRT